MQGRHAALPAASALLWKALLYRSQALSRQLVPPIVIERVLEDGASSEISQGELSDFRAASRLALAKKNDPTRQPSASQARF